MGEITAKKMKVEWIPMVLFLPNSSQHTDGNVMVMILAA